MLDLLASPTLVHRLRDLAQEFPNRIALTWLRDGEVPDRHLTFGELDASARRVAHTLCFARQQKQPSSSHQETARALLLFPPGLEFIEGFLGCLYAGVVPVPLQAPRTARKGSALAPLIQDCHPSFCLSTREWIDLNGQANWLAGLTVLDVAAGASPSHGCALPKQDRLAFLQYTSGSTGRPKGVQVSHANLMANQAMIQRAFETDEETVFVSWLPPFHDMGLVGSILHPLWLGVRAVLLPPAAFIQKPVRWLRAVSRFRGTVSGGPNFAYELCSARIQPQAVQDLDLSSWKVAFNGAEPVKAATVQRFTQAFSPAGFSKRSWLPCYGMAEATLFATGIRASQDVRTLHVQRSSLEHGEIRVEATESPATQALVGCGQPDPSAGVQVVDPQTRNKLPDGTVGEVWLEGPHIAGGYHSRPKESQRFQAHRDDGSGPFLRTGDLGFLYDGQLYLAGRSKDLLIVNGRNLYPQDLEAAIGASHAQLRADGCAVFGREGQATEQIVAVAELSREAWRQVRPAVGQAASLQELQADLLRRARESLAGAFEVRLHTLAVVAPGTLPRTSSGKLQRQRTRSLLLSDDPRLHLCSLSPHKPDSCSRLAPQN